MLVLPFEWQSTGRKLLEKEENKVRSTVYIEEY